MDGIIGTLLKYSGLGSKPATGKKPPEPLDLETPGMARVEELSYAMLDVKAADVRQALAAADSGDVSEQAALAASVLDSRDLKIMAHWATRRNAVLACDWDVAAIDSGDDDKAMEMRKALDKADVRGLIATLCDAAYHGYSASLVEWDAKNGIPERFIPAHPTRFRFDYGGFPAISISPTGGHKPLAEMEPGRVVFSAAGDLPHKSGICRGLLWVWLFKRDCLLHRARHLDRFGSPIIKAKVTEAQWADKAGLNALMTKLRESVARGVALYPAGAEMEFAAAAASSQADFSKFIADLDDMVTIAILGQTATSGAASGFSKGQAQENVRLDILASDCQRIMSAIKRQLLDHMARFMFGESYADAFEFRIDYEPDDDLSQRATIVKTLSDSGYAAEDEWVSETFGIPLKKKTEPPPVPSVPFGLAPEKRMPEMGMEEDGKDEVQMAMSDFKPASAIAEEEFVSRVTESALSRLLSSKGAVSEFYMPLRREVGKVFASLDPDDPNLVKAFSDRAETLFKRYPAIYEAMGAESGDYQKVFKAAVLTAVAGAGK